jgi:hypothetical protein
MAEGAIRVIAFTNDMFVLNGVEVMSTKSFAVVAFIIAIVVYWLISKVK